MTQAVFGRDAAGEEPVTAWRLLTIGAAALVFLIYSQFWVFPLLGESGDPAASGIVRMLYLPAYAATLGLCVLSPRETLLATLRQPFLIVLLLIVVLSTAWSVAPDQTLRRAVALCFTTLGAIILAARYRWETLTEILAGCFALLTVIAILVSLLVPSIGVMHSLFPGAWRGVWPEKNALGGIMALGFVVLAAAAVLNPRRALLWSGFAILALFLVLMSTSKTSLVSLMLGFGGLIFVALVRRNPAAGVTTIWLAVLGVAMVAALFLFASDLFFSVLGKDATFTGRTQIWDAAMRQIERRPWTGYGYGVVWDLKGVWAPLAEISRDAGFVPIHAHNSWIEQWLGLGVFGLAAFAMMYFQTVVLAVVAVFRDRGAYLAVPFLMVYSLMTLTESIAVTFHDFRWLLFVTIAVKLAWPDREISTPSARRR
ncbi:MAG: O-antigen ligase [Pseudomonadota bacterium]|uniref:O-antigen ligase family protein n=1 Tax=unclassified Phenylobacterium TaxID=2640670 RepID=UPI000A511074|nr:MULTISPECIES: O-antigen ligase [unclassified Phenylobacterium]